MAQLLVRDLPGSVKEALRTRAARNHRSMEAEARQILVAAVTADTPDPVRSWLDQAAALRAEYGGVDIPVPARERSRAVGPL